VKDVRFRRKRLWPLLPLSICLFFLLAFALIEHGLRDTIISIARAEAQWTATTAINEAVLASVNNVAYQDIIHLERDADQKIVFMQPDLIKVNRLAAEATLEMQNKLVDLKDRNIYIPLGQILGSKLLASYGPRVRLALIPIGTVQVKIKDGFEEAGINQTRHRIYLEVESMVKVMVPFISSEVPVVAQIPVAEAVIVGPVPQAYFKFNYPEQQSQP
jgi:sporulation protein YunB